MLKIIGETNPGRVRSMNQDVFAYQTLGDNCGFAIVCDGMGGARAGDVAAKQPAKWFLPTSAVTCVRI